MESTADGTVIEAHAVVLAAASPVFRAALTRAEFAEARERRIRVAADGGQVRCLVRSCYGDFRELVPVEGPLVAEELAGLLAVAHMYELRGALDAIGEAWARVESFCALEVFSLLARFAGEPACDAMLERCRFAFSDNASALMATAAWLDLDESCVTALLALETCVVATLGEEQWLSDQEAFAKTLFEGGVAWMLQDAEARYGAMAKILEAVPLVYGADAHEVVRRREALVRPDVRAAWRALIDAHEARVQAPLDACDEGRECGECCAPRVRCRWVCRRCDFALCGRCAAGERRPKHECADDRVRRSHALGRCVSVESLAWAPLAPSLTRSRCGSCVLSVSAVDWTAFPRAFPHQLHSEVGRRTRPGVQLALAASCRVCAAAGVVYPRATRRLVERSTRDARGYVVREHVWEDVPDATADYPEHDCPCDQKEWRAGHATLPFRTSRGARVAVAVQSNRGRGDAVVRFGVLLADAATGSPGGGDDDAALTLRPRIAGTAPPKGAGTVPWDFGEARDGNAIVICSVGQFVWLEVQGKKHDCASTLPAASEQHFALAYDARRRVLQFYHGVNETPVGMAIQIKLPDRVRCCADLRTHKSQTIPSNPGGDRRIILASSEAWDPTERNSSDSETYSYASDDSRSDQGSSDSDSDDGRSDGTASSGQEDRLAVQSLYANDPDLADRLLSGA